MLRLVCLLLFVCYCASESQGPEGSWTVGGGIVTSKGAAITGGFSTDTVTAASAGFSGAVSVGALSATSIASSGTVSGTNATFTSVATNSLTTTGVFSPPSLSVSGGSMVYGAAIFSGGVAITGGLSADALTVNGVTFATVEGETGGSLIPLTNNSYSLGNTTNYYQNAYINSLRAINANITTALQTYTLITTGAATLKNSVTVTNGLTTDTLTATGSSSFAAGTFSSVLTANSGASVTGGATVDTLIVNKLEFQVLSFSAASSATLRLNVTWIGGSAIALTVSFLYSPGSGVSTAYSSQWYLFSGWGTATPYVSQNTGTSTGISYGTPIASTGFASFPFTFGGSGTYAGNAAVQSQLVSGSLVSVTFS